MKPKEIIDIPQIENSDLFESNREKAETQRLDSCPCCGKGIKNPQYYIHSIYGGCAYPSDDMNEYPDSWDMAVGSECCYRTTTFILIISNFIVFLVEK